MSRNRDIRDCPGAGADERGQRALARDLLVAHFHDSHRDTFARARRRLGATAGDDEVLQAVQGAVRLVFRWVNADFANPTREELSRVAHALARKAAAWGTAPDVVEGQLQRMLAAIGRACVPGCVGCPPVRVSV